MIHTEQHDSVEGSAGKNGGIPVQHGVEGLFQLQRTTEGSHNIHFWRLVGS